MQQLFWLEQQLVEPVGLGRGVREPPAALHQRVEGVGTIGGKRNEQPHDRVPRMRRSRAYDVATDFTLGASGRRHIEALEIVIAGCGRREDSRVEDTHVTREAGDRQALVHGGDHTYGDGFTRVHQRFEPCAEVPLVELIITARRRAPEVEVEDGRQLLGRRCCDEGATGVEPVISNQMMKDLGTQTSDDVRKVRRVEEASKSSVHPAGVIGRRNTRGCRDGLSEGLAAVAVATTTIGAFRHELPMIRVAAANEQS